MGPILAIHPVARATLLLALAIALAAFIVWLVTRFRGGEVDDTRELHDSLTKFRELHARGGLSDEEYRTIKTKLAAKLDSDLPAGAPPEDASPESPLPENELGDSSRSD